MIEEASCSGVPPHWKLSRARLGHLGVAASIAFELRLGSVVAGVDGVPEPDDQIDLDVGSGRVAHLCKTGDVADREGRAGLLEAGQVGERWVRNLAYDELLCGVDNELALNAGVPRVIGPQNSAR